MIVDGKYRLEPIERAAVDVLPFKVGCGMKMKSTAPDDLEGRMINCQKRAMMLGEVLQVLAHTDYLRPQPDTLDALGLVAEELAVELGAIEEAMP